MSNETEKYLIESLTEVGNEKINKNKISQLINMYIKKLSNDNDSLSIISNSLADKYIKVKSKPLQDKLISIISKYMCKMDRYNTFLKFFNYQKWKKIYYKAERNNSGQNHSSVNFYTQKEEEELKECTFKPVVNSFRPYDKRKYNYNSSSSKSIYEKLYDDYKRMKISRELKSSKFEGKTISMPFKPKMYGTPKKYINNMSFNERLDCYSSKKSQNKSKIIDKIESDFHSACTFNPKLNKNRANSKSRLLDYNKPTNISTTLSGTVLNNNQISSGNCSPLNVNTISANTEKRKVDLKRIEQLYNTYKDKKKHVEEIKATMEQESGITFKPFFYTSNTQVGNAYKTKVESVPFMERNNQFLKIRNAVIDGEREAYYENMIPRQKKYTNKEREEANLNVVNRLYKEGLEKIKYKNGLNVNIDNHKDQ